MPLCQNARILGAYAQTELGHGSDVSSLETTATFDKASDEFVIHTPTMTAIKWWPGDVGIHCTHTIVFANLIIDGNKYGVMPFLCQIRDCDTFMPCTGIKLGDMGPKLGYNSKNNGWLSFDNVRIPREQMLMKYVSVDREGNFQIEGDTRVLYSVMMDIRVQLI
jgi:acyl-CoA oxidase